MQLQNTGGGTNFRKALTTVLSDIHMLKLVFAGNQDRLDHATRAIFLITDAQETSSLDKGRIEKLKSVADNLKKGNNCTFVNHFLSIKVFMFKMNIQELISNVQIAVEKIISQRPQNNMSTVSKYTEHSRSFSTARSQNTEHIVSILHVLITH